MFMTDPSRKDRMIYGDAGKDHIFPLADGKRKAIQIVPALNANVNV